MRHPRVGLALCTLAVALHRAGRTARARRPLARAEALGTDIARVAYVRGMLDAARTKN